MRVSLTLCASNVHVMLLCRVSYFEQVSVYLCAHGACGRAACVVLNADIIFVRSGRAP